MGWVVACRVSAQTIVEVGDAGDSLANYQLTTGTGALTTISGAIGTGDADLFAIYISNPSIFSASTVGSALGDPQMYLFRLNGTGILANDDTGGGVGLQSILPAGDSRLTALIAGTYLLGISSYNRDPVDASGNLIFDNTFPGLDAPLSSNPLDHWLGTGAPGNYSITLVGAQFVSAIPEPGVTTLLFGFAGAGALSLRIRGKRPRVARESR